MSREGGNAGGQRGSELWRSLDELAGSPEVRRWLEEFPGGLVAFDGEGVDRRRFLTLMAASFALAGVSGCTQEQPTEAIVPYVRQPEEFVPGRPISYATTLEREGWGLGVLVESHDGRPVKVEGNPDHPASLGATDIFAQASLLGLYDPFRSRAVRELGRPATWRDLREQLRAAVDDGRPLRLLTGHVTSPTLLAMIGDLLDRLPQARWHRHQPVGDEHARQGARIAFGRPLRPVYRFGRADVVLSLDCDPLFALPGSVRYARDLASRRRVWEEVVSPEEMSRICVVEPSPSITGANADHRLALSPHEIEHFLRSLAARLGVDIPGPGKIDERARRWVEVVAGDLERARGRCVVLAGESLPPWAHAAVHQLNDRLGATGRTVEWLPPAAGDLEEDAAGLDELAEEMRSGDVGTLLIVDQDPVYSAPPGLGFAEALESVPLSVHLGAHRGETGHRTRWHVPLAHDLESWGDARAFDGTASLRQPLIEPLFKGRTAYELLAMLDEGPVAPVDEMLRDHWADEAGGDPGRWWVETLRRGTIEGVRATPVAAEARPDAVRRAASSAAKGRGSEDRLELHLVPDPTVWDGGHAANPWLQELPKPLTTLTWDNALLVAPATAERTGLDREDVVEIRAGDRLLRAPVWVHPGQAENALTLSLGYGRAGIGDIGSGLGVNAYRLRDADHRWTRPVELFRTGDRWPLATTQNHHRLEGRRMWRGGSLEQWRREPERLAHEPGHAKDLESLYPKGEETGRKWGMAIDLTSCIGCGACTIACQAENNIPVVGKDQVIAGREMHWIRVDRYYTGDPEDPGILHQPVPCMHCEHAPCEVVCPTGATQHSLDGLNEMIYNRCVGTRYCSNNCPYKVRRFNFFKYVQDDVPVLALRRNPEVTVRGRGVMEKCSYCVQRIRRAEIDAHRDGREVADGAVVTACQQVCPTQAIVFGDMNDPDTAVSRLKSEPHSYEMLHELNVRPRTSYLAAVRNPNPRLAEEGGDEGEA